MKRIITLLTFVTFFSSAAIAQIDLSVTQITAPVSSCAMTATENVTIKVFNFGATLLAGTSFNVNYTINAGGPVTELLTLASNLTSNSTYTYTFLTQANLSVPAVYTFTSSVTIVGDISPANDNLTGYVVTNTAPSVGGIVTGPGSVCISGNAGNLTLAGNTGAIVRWEYSTDGGFTWINITNPTSTQPYNNLTVPTQYRALVQNGTCATAYSSIASITIDPVSVGGTLNSNASVCTGINGGTLTLVGKTGNVARWEFSIDNGVTWNNIANVTTTLNYTNLVITTKYRVRVVSGTCSAAYSTIVTITVMPATVAGNINAHATTVCQGANAGTLVLSGQVGTISRWEYSIDNGVTWVNIVNSTVNQAYLNLNQTRLYRARVQSNPCSVKYSDTATVTVTGVSVGGSIAPNASQVCTGINGDTLLLSGETGLVTQWEFSTDGGLTWTIVANITDTMIYSNLVTTTMYRALVQNGGCTSAYSATATVTVNPTSIGGTISGGTTVCASGNSGVLTLGGFVGSIVRWESSPDNVTWSPIANTTNSQAYNNLVATTYYQAIVQSGVCSSDTAIGDTVIVDPVTVGGTVLPAASTVCSGLNAGVLTLNGNVGNVVQWEYSTDGGLTWIIIINPTTSQAYNNISTATIYRALVMSGVCTQAYSSQAILTVNAQALGGTLYSDATVCSGANGGTLTLVGFSGSITQWESSSDNGLTWTAIANNTFSNAYLNLLDTTMYRVLVNSGVCPTDTSTVVTITVDDPSVGGTVTLDATVCSGLNAGTLTLNGYTGNVYGWESSIDGGITWVNIANTTNTQGYLNLTQTTMYQARVGNGVCPSVTSIPATITVTPATMGGTISGSTSTCEGTGSGVLTLSGYSSVILGWETSTDGGLTWSPIPNNSTTENWSNPVDTVWYHVLVTNGVCPMDTSSVAEIIVYPKPVAGFTAPPVCLGNPTIFTDTTSVATGNILFHQWDFADNNASVATNPINVYANANTYNVSLIVISDMNCKDTIMQNVLVNPLPSSVITVSNSLTLCTGDSTELSVLFAPQNHYLWNTGSTVDSVFASTTGNYVINVTDTITGCSSMDSVTVNVLVRPTADAGIDTVVSAGSSIVLLGSGGSSYIWSPTVGLSDPTDANPTCLLPYTVTYTLTVTDFNGCSDTDAVLVTFVKDYNVIISNLVTINGDGYNDVWNIQNIEFYPENKVSIFNRNGMLVFEQEGYNNSWMGTFNGNQLPDGTYYYVLEFTDSGDTVKGAVTLISDKK